MPEEKKPEGIPSPLQPRGGRPMPRMNMIEISMPHGKAKKAKLPATIDLLSYLMLVMLFIVSAAIASDTTASTWVSLAGNISFIAMVAAGAIAIMQSIMQAQEDDDEHVHFHGSDKRLPPEVKEALDHLVRHH